MFSFSANSQIIYIDPGHGYGATTSNNPDGRTATEIESALAVGLRVKTLLTNSCPSVIVHMSRTTNINGWSSVSARALQAQNWNADRLLSLHCNADGDATNDASATSTATGTETYYGTDPELTPNTQSAAVNKAYATKVQAEVALKASMVSRNGGVPFNRNNLGIFGRSTTACLNEMGFVDNASNKAKLLSETGRDNFALGFFTALKSNLVMTCNGVAPGTFSLTATPQCSGTTSRVALSWTASANATSYDIYRNGVYYDNTINLTYTNTTGVVAGATITYYVKAKNAGTTQTTNSNGTISVVALNCNPIPGTFTLAVISECVSGATQNKLTWTASANATAYDVYRNGALYYANATTTTWINSFAITPGTVYSYYVKAKNTTTTQTTNSNGTLSVTAVSCLPGAFTLTVTPDCSGTDSRMNLTWNASTGAATYDIYRNGNLYASGVTGTQFLNTYLISAGSTYTYSMVAKNSIGTTANSNGTVSKVAVSCRSAFITNPLSEETQDEESVINKIIVKNEINLYPNPTDGEFFLSIDNMLDKTLALTIFNLTGQIVYTKIYNSSEEILNQVIDIKNLPNGIYLIKTATDGKEYNNRIIKN